MSESRERRPSPIPDQPEVPKQRAESFQELGIDAGDTVTDTKGFQGRILSVEYDKEIPGGGKVATEITRPDGSKEERLVPMDRFLERQDTIASIKKPEQSEEIDALIAPTESEKPESVTGSASTAESPEPLKETLVEPNEEPRPSLASEETVESKTETDEQVVPTKPVDERVKEIPQEETARKKKTGHKAGSALEKRSSEQITNEILEKRRELRYLKTAQEESHNLRSKTRKMEDATESFRYTRADSIKKSEAENADSIARDFRLKLARLAEIPYVKERFLSAKLDGFKDLRIRNKTNANLAFSEEPWKIRDSLRKFDDSLDTRSLQVRQELKRLEREAEL